MSAYVIVQVNITDPAKYEEYKPLAEESLAKHGGKYLVRGGTAEDVEGQRAYERIVLLEFEDVARAKAWYRSPEYVKARVAREGGSTGVFTVVDGLE